MPLGGVMSDRMLCMSSECVYATHRCSMLHSNEANDANDNHFTLMAKRGGGGGFDASLFQLRAHITSKICFDAINSETK